ncbi:hypothetical protein VTK26DRAFT_8587 [Humicola hyalothermophila]
MAHRPSAPDLPRPERWDRGRYEYERDRDLNQFEEIRDRFADADDHVYTRRRAGPPPRDPSPPRSDDRPEPRRLRPRDLLGADFDDDASVVRERRRVVYDDEPLPLRPRRRSPSPPPPPGEVEERSRVVIERERYRSPSPAPRRPGRVVRRQSSLDTFDRPRRAGDEYGPPARRDDEYRVPPYVDMPLPRSRALPPPRVYAEREYYDDIRASDARRYGDDDFLAHPPERVREREIIRTRRRSRSRESRSVSHYRGRSRSSSSSSSSSSDDGTRLTARSEYPKKGKTRIPARLVSKRALIDLGYPFMEEGKTIVVQKALGQHNINELLKLSDDYKKSELEIMAARSSAGELVEERIEHRTEVYENATPPPVIHHHHHYAAPAPPAATAATTAAPGSGPIIVTADPPPATPVEVVKTTVVRDLSPARTYTAYDTYDSGTTTTTTTTTTYYDDSPTTVTSPVILDAYHPRDREVSAAVPVGPVALAADAGGDRHLRVHYHHRSHSRHRSRSSRRRSKSRGPGGGELVRAERLPTGELVVYEEEVERVQEPVRGGIRIERDKRGPPPRLMKAMLATLT